MLHGSCNSFVLSIWLLSWSGYVGIKGSGVLFFSPNTSGTFIAMQNRASCLPGRAVLAPCRENCQTSFKNLSVPAFQIRTLGSLTCAEINGERKTMECCPDGLRVLHARAVHFPFAPSRKQHYLQMMSLSSELDLLHSPFLLALEDIQGASSEPHFEQSG